MTMIASEVAHRYGHFNDDGSFTITDPKCPRAFDNLLWNDSMFSNVQQTGVGYIDYQIGDTEAVQLLTGIGRICDFDVHGRDGLMSRLIYIRDNETGAFWNLGWEPVRRRPQAYACTHGAGWTRIVSTTEDIDSSLRIFVPAGADPVECWQLAFTNTNDQPRSLSIFIYNQFSFSYKWGFDSYGDMLFRSSHFNQAEQAMVASKHPHHTPHDWQTAFLACNAEISSWDGVRDAFVGSYNTLADPQAVVDGRCSNTPGSCDATIGAVQIDIDLAAGETRHIDAILAVTDGEAGVAPLKARYLGQLDSHFAKLQEEKAALVAQNRISTPDAHFDRLFNTWIKQETLYGATWCRWGWMGYRDIVQHGYGVSSFKPERTREILIEALQHQYASGLALRGWNPVDAKPYSDSALWLVFTLCAYLKDSGDLALLDEMVPYFDEGAGTVREHIERAVDFLEGNKGQHGLLLIKFGDWNDSLTAVGKEGRGESIWLSMAYAEAMLLLQELAEQRGADEAVNDYARRYAAIKQALNDHAWDGDWYVRCFDDTGRPIGSDASEQGKIFLNAQSWAMIAGIADDQRRQQLLAACDERLQSPLGYLLLAPTFTKRDDHIGRISCLEPGICENGTVYSHGNVFMILGLLRAGERDKAYEVFKQISPGYLSGEDDPKQRCPTYVYANGYFGPAHANNAFQMEFTWMTGSVAWFYNVILREFLGVQPGYDALRIAPQLPSAWPEASIDYSWRGKRFQICIRRGGQAGITCNGRPITGDRIPFDQAENDNQIVVNI